ncbi:MAG: restriction endonuclease subunit S [Oscillospiraceae bacterium]|nr:restriction endonuclease subunit S [Oscillospiraceae bacterium]
MSKLGKLVTIKTGKLDANASSENGKYLFFTCSKEPLKIDAYSYDCECVLVAGNGDLNVKYYNGRFDAYQRTYIIESNNTDKLSNKYLFYFLENKIDKLRQQAIGGVIKYIKLNNLTDIKIPNINIKEQIKVVNILDKMQNIIEIKQKQLNNLDELVKARFVEMFGDIAKNSRGFEAGTIRDVVRDVKYGTSAKSTEHGKYIYLRMNNITYDGKLDLTDIKYINIADNEFEKYVVREGDILFNRTNSKELVGKTCVFKEKTEMIMAGYLIRVRVNNKAIPEYLSAVLNSKYGKTTLQNMCKSIIGQANINAQELQDINIIIPPIKLQNEFASFVQHIDKLKTNLKSSLEKLKKCQGALMNKYFGIEKETQEEVIFIGLEGIDIAKYILSKVICTHLKLEKLAYFCYAEYLVKHNAKLFSDDIYAFRYGPVVQTVNERYKSRGKEKSDDKKELSVSQKLASSIKKRIMATEDGSNKINIIDKTIEKYGDMTASQLVDLTHNKNTPWYVSPRKKNFSKIKDEDIIKYHKNETI